MNEEAVPDNRKKAAKFDLAFFAGKQMQVKSRVVLFSWYVNKKLKTKLNYFLKKWFQTQKEFRQSSF